MIKVEKCFYHNLGKTKDGYYRGEDYIFIPSNHIPTELKNIYNQSHQYGNDNIFYKLNLKTGKYDGLCILSNRNMNFHYDDMDQETFEEKLNDENQIYKANFLFTYAGRYLKVYGELYPK